MSLVLWVAREEDKASAEDVPAFTSLPVAFANAPIEAKPAELQQAQANASPATPIEAAGTATDDKSRDPTMVQTGLDALPNPLMPETLLLDTK